MRVVRAVVFDMDGVLINAKDWHFAALNIALERYGYRIDRRDHLAIYDGLPTRRKLEILTRDRGLPARHHENILSLKQACTMDLIRRKCQPMLQHVAALSDLKASGYRIAVASNSMRETVDAIMEKTELAPFLDATVSNQDVKNAKPDPEIYFKAFEKIGVSPREVLVVEDNKYGIEAARAAGAHVTVVEGVNDVTSERVFREIRNVDEAASASSEHADVDDAAPMSRDSRARRVVRR